MLWGSNTKPKFLSSANGQSHQTFADPRGWVVRRDKGGGRYWEEVLVAGSGFPGSGGTPDVTAVAFTGIEHYALANASQTVNTSLVPVGAIVRQANSTANTGFGIVLSINAAANSFVLQRTSGRFNTSTDLAFVSPAGLANVALGAANNYSVGNVTVFYNERVVTTGTPTINVDSTTTANVSASLLSGNNTNQLVFNFTVLATTASVISISANSIALAGGTIKDAADTSVNANNQFVSGTIANAAFGQSGKTLAV